MKGLIIFIAILFILSACKTGSTKKSRTHWDFLYIAWNQDTVLPYEFGMLMDNRFVYTISRKDINHGIVKEYYSGQVRNTIDTIYLIYKHNKKPPQFNSFLIKEISGNYLIQKYGDSSKRIFLRINNLTMR